MHSKSQRSFENKFLCQKNSVVNIINSTHMKVKEAREIYNARKSIAIERANRRDVKIAKLAQHSKKKTIVIKTERAKIRPATMQSYRTGLDSLQTNTPQCKITVKEATRVQISTPKPLKHRDLAVQGSDQMLSKIESSTKLIPEDSIISSKKMQPTLH